MFQKPKKKRWVPSVCNDMLADKREGGGLEGGGKREIERESEFSTHEKK
jgi:hypothetical protein